MTWNGRESEKIVRVYREDRAEAAESIDVTIDYSMALNRSIRVKSQPWNSYEIGQYFREADLMSQYFDDDSRQDQLKTILYEGILNDDRFDVPVIARKSYHEDRDWPENGRAIGDAEAACRRRRAIARLFIKAPDMASDFVGSNTTFVHGTGAVALPPILENGLMSSLELERNEYPLLTGERILSVYDSDKIGFYEWDNFFRAEQHAYDHCINPTWLLKEIMEENGPSMFKRGRLMQKTIAMIEASRLHPDQMDIINDVYEVVVGIGSRALSLYETIFHPSQMRKPFDAAEPHFKTPVISTDHIVYVFAPQGKVEQTRRVIENSPVEPGSIKVTNMKLMNASLNPRLDFKKFLSQSYDD